jgi:hypothetical protein
MCGDGHYTSESLQTSFLSVTRKNNSSASVRFPLNRSKLTATFWGQLFLWRLGKMDGGRGGGGGRAVDNFD